MLSSLVEVSHLETELLHCLSRKFELHLYPRHSLSRPLLPRRGMKIFESTQIENKYSINTPKNVVDNSVLLNYFCKIYFTFYCCKESNLYNHALLIQYDKTYFKLVSKSYNDTFAQSHFPKLQKMVSKQRRIETQPEGTTHYQPIEETKKHYELEMN